VVGLPFPVRAAGVSLALVVLVSCTGGTATPSPTPPPVQVRLDGEALQVAPGTTLGTLLTAAARRPEAGHLLAVDGAVLERKAYPGRIELNGRVATRSTVLRTGDRIRIVDGTDKTEPMVRIVRNVSPRVGDPERTLTVYPTRRITIQGRVSGTVASVTDRSIGRGHAPRAVALTFDDGPWPGATERILRVLHRFHVHATFFEIGSLASQHPRLVGRVLAGGNEIGNHTFDHPETMAHQSAEQVAAELRHASAVLADVGVDASLFRPPGGWYDDELVQQAREQGMRLVTWDVDPRDWRAHVTPREISRAVLSQVHAGSIVLLHDGGGDAGHTIRALPAIIKGIRARGLRFVTVPARPI
jgi:peptidoglycan/xylan/chitin deacetylase (PgdA/CDA1 family)/sulfur carrier protein ThiS